MSVTFSIAGLKSPARPCAEQCEVCGPCLAWLDHEAAHTVNLSNANACELLAILGQSTADASDLYGSLSASALRRACAKALLWCEDVGIPARQEGRVIHGARRPSYVREKLTALAGLATQAGDLGRVVWG